MKKAILIVSFGTTYPETRQKNIAAITRQVRALYPDVLVAEAVSSTIVRNVMKKREHMDAKSPEEGLIKLKEQGATHVAVFPTHVIDGIENHRMKQAVEEYRLAFEQITVADALLTEPEDYTNVAKALWESLKEETGDAPLILMGHGTEHAADSSYAVMEQALRAYAQHPVYIATVEGKRTIADVIAQMKFEGIVNTKVIVAPFMLVAGDHANNDMAGEEDSFASLLREEGYAPECILRGIAEYPAIREVYLSHLQKTTGTLFADITAQNRPGILYGIGVGPGDPELMTIKALRILKECDVVFAPGKAERRARHTGLPFRLCRSWRTGSASVWRFPWYMTEKAE